MNIDLIHAAQLDLFKSMPTGTESPLWRHCESGGFPSKRYPAEWKFEKGVIDGDSIHLRFRVYFTEEAAGCCVETPSLKPLFKVIHITRSIESGVFEAYADESVLAPQWAMVFGSSAEPPCYEDSFC